MRVHLQNLDARAKTLDSQIRQYAGVVSVAERLGGLFCEFGKICLYLKFG